MSSLAVELHPQAINIAFNDESMIVELADGRTITVPIVWFPTLANATIEQLNNWQLIADGEGLHWPDLDEDLSVNGLLMGIH